jgi:hypothetical protein
MIYIENKQDLNHNHNNDANRSLEPRGQSVGHLSHANNHNNNYEVGHLASSNAI